MQVDAQITVEEGHAIAHKLKDTLMRQFPDIADILIHVEPFPSRILLHLQDEDIAAGHAEDHRQTVAGAYCRLFRQGIAVLPVYLQGATCQISGKRSITGDLFQRR